MFESQFFRQNDFACRAGIIRRPQVGFISFVSSVNLLRSPRTIRIIGHDNVNSTILFAELILSELTGKRVMLSL